VVEGVGIVKEDQVGELGKVVDVPPRFRVKLISLSISLTLGWSIWILNLMMTLMT